MANISLRSVAMLAGRKTYTSPKPCRRGHTSPRSVQSASCVECNLARTRISNARISAEKKAAKEAGVTSTNSKRKRTIHENEARSSTVRAGLHVGLRVSWRSPICGIVLGTVTKIGEYHFWAKDHGQPVTMMQPVEMVRIDWIVRRV